MHRQHFFSPTWLNTAFMTMFLRNSGITRTIICFSLLTFTAMRLDMTLGFTSRPSRWCTA